MRKIVAASAFVVVAVSASMVACNKAADEPSGATSADVERDLNLASSVQSQRTGIVSPIEQIANGAPSGNEAGKRVGVQTKKRAPLPAPSPTVADVATAPPDVNEVFVPTTAAAVTTEVASAGTGGSAMAAATVMVTDPIRSTTLSVATLGTGANTDMVGAMAGYNPHRPGLRVVRAVWERFSVRPGAIIRGASTGMDHCEPPKLGGGGILGATFGGTGTRRAPVGATAGGVGVDVPENLPQGMGTSRGPAAGGDNHSPTKW